MKETHKVHSYSSESAKCTENLSAVRICLVNPLRPKLLIEFFLPEKSPHFVSSIRKTFTSKWKACALWKSLACDPEKNVSITQTLYIWCSQIILYILIAVVSSLVSENTVVSNFGKMAPVAFFYLILWFKIWKYYQFCLSRNKVYLYIYLSLLELVWHLFIWHISVMVPKLEGKTVFKIYIQYIYIYTQQRKTKAQQQALPALSTVQGIAYRTQITL